MASVTRIACAAATLMTCFAAHADGDGLAADADRVPWARFQGRISYVTAEPSWRSDFGSAGSGGLKVNGLSLMGDVYLGASPESAKAQFGGFRATSGVLLGLRSPLWGAQAMAPSAGLLSVDRRLFGATGLASGTDPNADTGPVPYLGIGYSSLAGRSGWSFSADLGLVSLSPGNAVRLGRVVSGGQSLDDVIRDMRLAPVFQLGASYSF